MAADTRFLQIHTLTPYSATLLNRDDIGRAKRLPFGGVDRIRISSQALKRRWRRAVDEWSLSQLAGGISVRSRHIFDWEIAPKLRKEGVTDEVILGVLRTFKALVLGESERAKATAARTPRKKVDPDKIFEELMTQQVVVLGRPEIDYLTKAALEIAAEASDEASAAAATEAFFKDRQVRENIRSLMRGAGLDVAMFGRMVTSDILANTDSSVHVAHAFTVNGDDAEPDYFTAVDDLVEEAGRSGSAHINSSELTTGLFYGYVVVDVPKLVENMSGDAVLASKSVESLIHLIATVSPGAKRGSTAPYAAAEMVMVEAGARQPRSLANAFMNPVPSKGLQEKAIAAMADYLARYDAMYEAGEQRRFASMYDIAEIGAERLKGLSAIANWSAEQVREAAE